MDVQALLQERQEKDVYFKSHPYSPLTPEQQALFTHLDYFRTPIRPSTSPLRPKNLPKRPTSKCRPPQAQSAGIKRQTEF